MLLRMEMGEGCGETGGEKVGKELGKEVGIADCMRGAAIS